MIVVLDSCGANFTSVINAFKRLDVDVRLSSNANTIRRAKAVILPGVGNALSAMQKLHQLRLTHILPKLTQPVLGICLGMQLLFERSLEGNVDCLGIVPGMIEKFSESGLCIPHMGWNKFVIEKPDDLFTDIDLQKNYVYFVHSYKALSKEYSLANTTYGDEFCSIVKKNNFYGMQFHPEKSGTVGRLLLENFVSLL